MKKAKIESIYLEGGDCIKIYWDSLGATKNILGYTEDKKIMVAISLEDGTFLSIPRAEYGVTLEAIEKASGGMVVEYIGKLNSFTFKKETIE